MKNDMNLIMENWRENIKQITSKEQLETVGELRAFVKVSRAKKAGAKIASTIIGLLPGVGKVYKAIKTAKSIPEAFKILNGTSDSVKTNTGMDRLNIDDDYSKIVDDDIENGFLDDFLAKLSELPDDAPIPDANAQLEDYLRFKFNQRTVDIENEK